VVATDPPATPTSQETDPAAETLATYRNGAYGFSFRYPAAWQRIEGKNYVSLNQGSVNLVVGYRHMTEDRNICCRQQMPEGEVVDAGSVTCAGEEIEKALLTCEGETKAVLYQGAEEIAVGELRFLFYLEDFNADYDAATIPTDVQAQVDGVITSLVTFEPDAAFATATPRPTKLPPTPEPTEEPTATPATPTSSPAMAQAQAQGANLRSGPGTDYALAGTLEGGERVEIIGRYGEWWQVAAYQGGTAWVYDGVVSATDTEAVPQVEAVPTKVPSSPALIPTGAPPSAIEEARWIDVDLSAQRLTAYENGQRVHSTLVSTGLPRTPTVRGQFRIWIKLRYDDMAGPDYYLEDVPHVMYFYQGYGLHGAPWHNNFGQRMSHGCVNLPLPEAEWLFNFADVGTLVNVRE
jgi:lipoprotein-anchoring transpeptidase ErfK/SrfK